MSRVLTAIVAIPLVVLLTLFAPNWLFAIVLGVVAALAVDEFLNLGTKKGIGRPARWFLVPAALVAVSFIGSASWVLTASVFSAIALMTVTIFSQPIDTALGRVGMGLSAMMYCSLTLGFLVWLQQKNLVLVLMAIIWVGDSAAYYCGRAFGRHLLAPRVSPKKTVEGAIAGLIGSVVIGTVGGIWVTKGSWPMLAAISAATAAAGQVGDLAESVLKRSAGVKDSSSILPGHGGILDRLDSLFFAAPIFYWFFSA